MICSFITYYYYMVQLIDESLFYCPNKDTYPPFKYGLYLEEVFLEYMKKNNKTHCKEGRFYIPVLWTNFQIESWFSDKKQIMQEALDKYIQEHPCEQGYFIVVQHDDGPMLKIPPNTKIYGACSGTEPLPLVYQDTRNTLIQQSPRRKFYEKAILCSFVGTNTHHVRTQTLQTIHNNTNFIVGMRGGWSAHVHPQHANNFIYLTLDSKFALAPRGYGRSSFRFFEIFQLGAIPIYVWDDIEWLPYKSIIDYSKICISINIRDIHTLESQLLSIDEEKYNIMMTEYTKIKHMFEPEYIPIHIVG
jgi:Exostosin family